MAWDYEARTDAYDQARDLAMRDPDAASYLLAHLDAPADDAPLPSQRNAYDPMALYARVAKYYGFSHQSIDRLPFSTFFGYLREASIMIEAENRANKTQAPPPPDESPQEYTRHFR